MKQLILLIIFTATTVFAYSQKVKLSNEDKKNYVSQEALEKERAKEQENKMVVYAILRAESEVGSEFVNMSLDESTGEIATKASTMQFPELLKLTRMKFSVKSEIDILNYLAERDWQIVTIENDSDKKMTKRKYYLKKILSL